MGEPETNASRLHAGLSLSAGWLDFGEGGGLLKVIQKLMVVLHKYFYGVVFVMLYNLDMYVHVGDTPS